ncbi:hypothetical protein DQ384_28995 [Sphaerisporangium album]|uniref:JmjC domain-containing protein n=1 Tax=Sphaerisporangium album TaxID=509200 RepID=A0A367F7Z6_9ACTN|nr:cupin domain-containing protein [Sphaerisporangium album]RCG26483.1 hypothetical protein DQ384_28995 [Sphaerisporangium album]
MNVTPSGRVLPLLGDPRLFDSSWPDRPYHSARTAMGLREAFTWSSLDGLLNDQAIRLPAFRMARDNRLVPAPSITRSDRAESAAGKELADPVRMTAELGRGATLVLQGVHRRCLPLRDLTRRLATEIGHAVSVNAYLTPPSAQGFGAHFDPTHAWLTQLEGTKKWRLWEYGRRPATDAPDLELVLSEGDVLWIPRGWWHEGASGERPSLHLTFAVVATTLADVLEAVVGDLAQHAALAGELPPKSLSDRERAQTTVMDATMEIGRLLANLDVEALTERVVTRRLDPFDPLPARPLAEVLGTGRDGTVHTHPEGVLYSSADDTHVHLMTADADLAIPAELASDLGDLLTRTGSFSLEEIGEPLSGKVLDQLVEARLVCSAGCPEASVR